MNLTIQHVPLEHTAQTWPLIEGFVESAIPYGHGDYTLDQIRLMVCMGQWLLLVATDEDNNVHGAATVSFLNYPNHRVGFITFVGGEMIVNDHTFKQLCEILRHRGATKIQGAMRPSMTRLVRLHGFKEVTTIMEAKI